jgi:hypothetical protein
VTEVVNAYLAEHDGASLSVEYAMLGEVRLGRCRSGLLDGFPPRQFGEGGFQVAA